MRVSFFKSEAMILNQKKVNCFFWVKVSLMFKWLWDWVGDGWQNGASVSVMKVLLLSVLVKKELNQKTKRSI